MAKKKDCPHPEWDKGEHMDEAFGVGDIAYACVVCGTLRGAPTVERNGYELGEEYLQEILDSLKSLPGWVYDAIEGDNIVERIECVAEDEGVELRF